MRKNVLFLFMFLLFAGVCCGAGGDDVRVKTNINRDWKYFQGDLNDFPESATYDDSKWERVGLPHSFSIPYFRSADFYVGYGWYRKNLEVKKEWMDKKSLFLEFDGVFQVAEVFVNGEKVGEHRGGYTGFSMAVTGQVKPGRNVIAVRVNNLWNARLAPRAGEHVFSGGIYRDVYLTVTDPVHMAWNGVFVTTPEVNDESARVKVETEVENDGRTDAVCVVKSVIKAPDGKKVTEVMSETTVKPGEMATVMQQTTPISRPQLWSPESPVLYQVITSVYVNGKETDRMVSPLGFRWFEWTADKGFFLNGKHCFLRGANVHQDHAGWGDAVTKAGIYRDVRWMKEAGFNFIRGSHYPHHPYFAEACNELGMLFLSENAVWGIGGGHEEGYWSASTYPVHKEDEADYESSARQGLTEMIRIHRNNPSIVAWSMCNEPFFSDAKTFENMKKMLAGLVEESRRLDPTRKVVIGGAQRGKIDKIGDIAGYNGDGARLFRAPDVPSMVSEYGSCVADRPGDYEPCWGDIREGEEPEWRSGHAIWCGFDHGSIAGDMGKMGIVDFFRLPKRSWYWYRNAFRQIAPPEWPVAGVPAGLKLTADKEVIQGTDATDDVHLMVTVVDQDGKQIVHNPTVTLTIVSGPGEFPTGRTITFRETTADDIRILDGQAAIEFRSYEGGKSVIRATADGLEEAVFVVTTKGLPRYREGVTPVAGERKIQNFSKVRQSAKANVSAARPTKASGVKSGSETLFANDGNPDTFWEAAVSSEENWWRLDMENFYVVSGVGVMIPEGASGDFMIEVSEDGKRWTYAGRPDGGVSTGKLAITMNPNSYGRFLRIVFKGGNMPVKVAEVDVFGYNK